MDLLWLHCDCDVYQEQVYPVWFLDWLKQMIQHFGLVDFM